MSPLRRIAVLCGGVVAAVAVLAWVWVASSSAATQGELESWRTALSQAQAVRLQLARLPVASGGAPQPDRIATLARSMLVAAGVGQEALAGIQPLGDATLPGGDWHRQQVLLQLRGLSTAQAAAVVEAVARTDPSWSVSSIQLTHAGTGDRYDAGLALTTLYPAKP
jgi:hypothetical protein